MSRKDDAILIRDAAVALVASVGEMVKILGQDGSRLRNFAELDEVKILYQTPATADPQEIPPEFLEALKASGRPHLPYHLDIWDAQRKVFAVTWDEDGQFRIVSFKRGGWEERVMAYEKQKN